MFGVGKREKGTGKGERGKGKGERGKGGGLLTTHYSPLTQGRGTGRECEADIVPRLIEKAANRLSCAGLD
jgi:hypothetical protein